MVEIDNSVEVFSASVELKISSSSGDRVIEIDDNGLITCWSEDQFGYACVKVFNLDDDDGFDQLWDFFTVVTRQRIASDTEG